MIINNKIFKNLLSFLSIINISYSSKQINYNIEDLEAPHNANNITIKELQKQISDLQKKLNKYENNTQNIQKTKKISKDINLDNY